MIVLITAALPREGAGDHAANALRVLRGLAWNAPATWAVAELGRAERRATSALALLDVPGARVLAARHLTRAIETLCEAPVDWQIIPDARVACALLMRALFVLNAETDG